MTTAPSHRKKSVWPYALGLVLFFAFLFAIPITFAKRRFTYTVTGEAPTAAAKVPMEAVFAELKTTGPTGQTVTLADLAAQNPGGLLINFWATWCPPCIEEMPSLEDLDRQLKAKADPKLPKLVTISVDEHHKLVYDLYKTLPFKPGFLVLFDQDAEFAQSLGSTRFPETYLVAPDGTLRHKWLGPQDWTSDSVLRILSGT